MELFGVVIHMIFWFCGFKLVLSHWYWGTPAGLLAITYMMLNYFRFGHIYEFGHNYLPQFTENGKLTIDIMGNLNIFIVSPILLFAVLGFIHMIWKKTYDLIGVYTGIILLSVIYILFITTHKTMRAWGFGNRYAFGGYV